MHVAPLQRSLERRRHLGAERRRHHQIGRIAIVARLHGHQQAEIGAYAPSHANDAHTQRLFAAVDTVDKRKEKVGDIEVGVLQFTDEVEKDGETVEFTSTSYFFEGGGATWQIGRGT